jgi:hypothetical protein
MSIHLINGTWVSEFPVGKTKYYIFAPKIYSVYADPLHAFEEARFKYKVVHSNGRYIIEAPLARLEVINLDQNAMTLRYDNGQDQHFIRTKPVYQ